MLHSKTRQHVIIQSSKGKIANILAFIAAPRLRSGSISTIGELNGVGKRPHSIISVSSSSASSSASSASSTHSSTVCPTHVGTLNLGFEPGDSPRALHRSVTRTSQCSAGMYILLLFHCTHKNHTLNMPNTSLRNY